MLSRSNRLLKRAKDKREPIVNHINIIGSSNKVVI